MAKHYLEEAPFPFKELCKKCTIPNHNVCCYSGLSTLLTFVECSVHGHRQLHDIVHALGVFHLLCGQALQLFLHQKTKDLIGVLRAAAVPLNKGEVRRADVTQLNISLSSPMGATCPFFLCSLPLSAPNASISPPYLTPFLQQENKARLFQNQRYELSRYLHHVDEVQKEFLGVLLSVSGKLRVSLSDQGLKHAGSNAVLHTLQRTWWKRKVVTVCQAFVLWHTTLYS